jgi:hypothetical protein
MFKDIHGKTSAVQNLIAAVAILTLVVGIVLMWKNPPEEYDPCAAEGKTKVITEYRSGWQYGRATELEVFVCR